MSVQRLTLLIDTRHSTREDVLASRLAFAEHCRDFISIGRIQGCRDRRSHAQRLLVSVHAIRSDDAVHRLVSECTVSLPTTGTQDGDGFAAVIQALTALSKERPSSRTSTPDEPEAALRPVVDFVHAQHQQQTAASLASPTVSPCASLLLVGSATLPHVPTFHALSHLCSTGLAFDLHCVITDASAVCLTHAQLGTRGQLWRCSLSPTESRMALEMGLAPWLLGRTRGALTVPCRVRCGHLSIRAVAQRPYVACLEGCTGASDFPSVQEECPGLVLCGTAVLQSPFELTRHASSATAVISLAAVLAPADVDDAWLCGSAWVVSLPRECTPQETAVLAALHAVLKGDALLFTTSQPHLDATHALALSSSSFVGYFLDEERLCLRQLIPSELRSACVTAAEPAVSTAHCRRTQLPDPALTARAQQVREEIVAQSSVVNVRDLLSGRVASVAAQLRPDAQFHLRLTR